jgi:hypothetical protein
MRGGARGHVAVSAASAPESSFRLSAAGALQAAPDELVGTARVEEESRCASACNGLLTAFSAKEADGAHQQASALKETALTVNEPRIAPTGTARKASEVATRARDSLEVQRRRCACRRHDPGRDGADSGTRRGILFRDLCTAG